MIIDSLIQRLAIKFILHEYFSANSIIYCWSSTLNLPPILSTPISIFPNLYSSILIALIL